MKCAGCYKPAGGARGTCVDPKPAKKKRGSFFKARIDPTPVFRRGRAPVDKRESIQ